MAEGTLAPAPLSPEQRAKAVAALLKASAAADGEAD